MNEYLQKNGESLCKDGARPWILGRSAAHGKEAGKGRIRVLQRIGPEGCRAHQIIEKTTKEWGLR